MSLFAMRRTEPKELAALLAMRRAERAKRWLVRHAPDGWRRNLFEPAENGRSTFRARDQYGDECALALAFEHCPDLADTEGHVTFGSVSNAFDLSPVLVRSHGFSVVPYRHSPECQISSDMLNKALETEFRKYDAGLRKGPRQHLRRRAA